MDRRTVWQLEDRRTEWIEQTDGRTDGWMDGRMDSTIV